MALHSLCFLGIYLGEPGDCHLVPLFRYPIFIFYSDRFCFFYVYPGGHAGDLPGWARVFYVNRCTHGRADGFYRSQIFNKPWNPRSRRPSEGIIC